MMDKKRKGLEPRDAEKNTEEKCAQINGQIYGV